MRGNKFLSPPVRRRPEFGRAAIWASSLALLDRGDDAKIALDTLMKVQPDFSPNYVMSAFSPLNPAALRPLFKTWIEGLRKAGLDIPDEPAGDD